MARDGSLADLPQAKQPTRQGSAWWGWLLDRLGRRRKRRHAAHRLYVSLVEQARLPVFYARLGVPDSRDGRLEMVTLHALLVMRRLRAEGRAGVDLAQTLFDVLFADLDQHLREWGVGDLAVGKQIKKLAQSFLGRIARIDPLLQAADRDSLAEVLRRNVYTEAETPDPAAVRRLAAYLLVQDAWLKTVEGAALLAGQVRFAPPGREIEEVSC